MFVICEPMFWLSWATSERPGWSQLEPTTDVPESPQRIVLSAFQESCV